MELQSHWLGAFHPRDSNWCSHLTAFIDLRTDHLPDYIRLQTPRTSPAKTFIFSFRLCFTTGSREWLKYPDTKQNLEYHHAELSLSNTSSDSGNITTAGFIIVKHRIITHHFFYLKELCRKLSPWIPFFDISLNRKTPTGKRFPHLIVKNGENDVRALIWNTLHVSQWQQSNSFPWTTSPFKNGKRWGRRSFLNTCGFCVKHSKPLSFSGCSKSQQSANRMLKEGNTMRTT